MRASSNDCGLPTPSPVGEAVKAGTGSWADVRADTDAATAVTGTSSGPLSEGISS